MSNNANDSKRCPSRDENCRSCRDKILPGQSYVEVRNMSTGSTEFFVHDTEQCTALMHPKYVKLIR
jgi:hypothetical protein